MTTFRETSSCCKVASGNKKKMKSLVASSNMTTSSALIDESNRDDNKGEQSNGLVVGMVSPMYIADDEIRCRPPTTAAAAIQARRPRRRSRHEELRKQLLVPKCRINDTPCCGRYNCRCGRFYRQRRRIRTFSSVPSLRWFHQSLLLLVLTTTLVYLDRHYECPFANRFVEAFTTSSTPRTTTTTTLTPWSTDVKLWEIHHECRYRQQACSKMSLNTNGISQPDFATFDDDDDDSNDIKNDKKKGYRNDKLIDALQSPPKPGYRLSPYHVLYPESFSEEQLQNQTLSDNTSVPLVEGLRLIKQSLEALIERADSEDTSGMPNTKSSIQKRRHRVVRIEQTLSHSVDPLCWLHSQVENHRPKKRSSLYSGKKNRAYQKQPVFYFASAEGTFEIAVFGSSYTHSRQLVTEQESANRIDVDGVDYDHQKYYDERMWKDLIPNLPDRARFYGGQRFDTATDIMPPSKEWKSFGQALWILPAVELRRENATITTVSIHLVAEDARDSHHNDHGLNAFVTSAHHVLSILADVTDHVTAAIPPTTLPPVLSRSTNYEGIKKRSDMENNPSFDADKGSLLSPSRNGVSLDGQELYERGVSAALKEFDNRQLVGQHGRNGTSFDCNNDLSKVVLARRLDLKFADQAYGTVKAIDILRRWKFSTQPGGHLFYICPDIDETDENEFFGCTPERLFQVKTSHRHATDNEPSLLSTTVISEALAGTRPRGSTIEADQKLSRQLFESSKDQDENQITGRFIEEAFNEMERRGWVSNADGANENMVDIPKNGISNYTLNDGGTIKGDYFVRRLRHLQHICQRFQCDLSSPSLATEAIRYLAGALHPTPAVNGYPKEGAMKFIREYERVGFDRGFYAGPLGFVGRLEADIVVAIRSGLVNRRGALDHYTLGTDITPSSSSGNNCKVSVFAGAGIVPGSTVQGEWAETSYKLAVVSSIFPQSPITLQNEQTPNTAWATAFIEELIRNGVTNFYVCPGSRSTPLVAAISKVVRSNVGVVHALSIHDERGAGFRAVGYGRGSGRPAAIITSSGTAIANLYPAIVEAGMDAIPMLVITADRPYESRDSGSNQAIDQVKAYSQTYVRWFRDILPPSDDVPVSLALADAAHGVSLSKQLKGPVHLNIQFRENLAPDAGPIRNDDRQGSTTRFDNVRFTDAPGFQRWSMSGKPWTRNSQSQMNLNRDIRDIVDLILRSKRGIIVVGNIRKTTGDGVDADSAQVNQLLSSFAETIGFPIFASALAADLRFQSDAVVPYAEHLLRCPLVQNNIKPDLILQFGTPLISTEIPKVIKSEVKRGPTSHVLIHPPHPGERADPELTVTQTIAADIGSFVRELAVEIEKREFRLPGSQLAPIVQLGRMLRTEMPRIIDETSRSRPLNEEQHHRLTEPQVMLEMSKMFSSGVVPTQSLFLSNSMPIRDAEAFLYPLGGKTEKCSLTDTGVNRGASGIDGIIASAAGFADATCVPTTLIIGDVAALHDINSLHSLKTAMSAKEAQAQKIHPLTTIVLNNDGGGIFSFLPIAKHGNDVSFDEFFGTPTNSFSFQKGSEAFDIPFRRVQNSSSLAESYLESLSDTEPAIIEAVVSTREENVAVHQAITAATNNFIISSLESSTVDEMDNDILPVKISSTEKPKDRSKDNHPKTMVMLHGWMGDKEEWKEVTARLTDTLPPGWKILTIDLPGHGKSRRLFSSEIQSVRNALVLGNKGDSELLEELSLDSMAHSVFQTLKQKNITSVDALTGYSLGGRVALAMKRLSMTPSLDIPSVSGVINDGTKMILVSTNIGIVDSTKQSEDQRLSEVMDRLKKDDDLSAEMQRLVTRRILTNTRSETNTLVWSQFLRQWYGAPLWGSLKNNRQVYPEMVERRIESLSYRAADHAAVLRQCSPPRCSGEDWRGVQAEDTLFVAGSLDKKYRRMGREWADVEPSLTYVEISGKGHALLVEDPITVADTITSFIQKEIVESDAFTERKIWNSTFIPSPSKKNVSHTGTRPAISNQDPQFISSIASLDFERFNFDVVDRKSKTRGLLGIGWGDNAKPGNGASTLNRRGVIIQVMSNDGIFVGLGEVSPLSGLHPETLVEAERQIEAIASLLSKTDPADLPSFDAKSILSLDGALKSYISSLLNDIQFDSNVYRSVWSGLEMSIVSLAAQVVRLPIHEAILANVPTLYSASNRLSMLPLNGLIQRTDIANVPGIIDFDQSDIAYPSWKIKIGHESIEKDVKALKMTISRISSLVAVRADANRGFDDEQIRNLVNELKSEGILVSDYVEYIEEPLRKQEDGDRHWTLEGQVNALENVYNETGLPYALDESLFDLLESHDGDYNNMIKDLREVFRKGSRGCAAIILKPSLLGLELSIQLARFARVDLGIGAVFTSAFETGIGLAHASFLASLSDATLSKLDAPLYPHGLSTFELLSTDCLTPSFGSYVGNSGILNVASISRALYGLGIDELQSLLSSESTPALPLLDDSVASLDSGEFSPSVFEATGAQRIQPEESQISSDFESSDFMADEFVASTSSSSNGRDIVVVASLPLPFSPVIAASRFTDLPQQPRWSPWLASVSYLDSPRSETEWTLRVRGVSFKWRATSEILEKPHKGIRWKSTSGVKNTGVVEFVPAPNDPNKCYMKLRMAFVTPRLMSSLFRGTVLEDFLRNKILKWSLEMFRDVVKGDLALEEGNVELGDALFGAVEGKASAIEQAFSTSSSSKKDRA